MARIDKTLASWPKPMPVEHWMARPAVTVDIDASSRAAIELMKSRGIRHLPVVDEGRLVGIVTDRDLRHIFFDPSMGDRLDGVDVILARRAVRHVMSWAVVSIGPRMEMRQAARLMHERKIGALPVVDAGRVIGMLTEHDVLRAFATIIPESVAKVRPLESPAGEAVYEHGFPDPERVQTDAPSQ
jgi:acetoin utilization protein AcuB